MTSNSESVDHYWIIGTWLMRILYPIAAIINICVICRELRNRKTIAKNTISKLNIYEKWLNHLSLAIMICYALSSIFLPLQSFPLVCKYIYGVDPTTYGLAHIILTLYQITRLKYCFSPSSCGDTQLGYSEYTFRFLYVIGAILFILMLPSVWLIHNPITVGKYACYSEYVSKYLGLVYCSFFVFIIWDWSVLIMYIYKIYQVQKKSKITEKNKNIFNRVQHTLRKIVILTLLLELNIVFTTIMIPILIFTVTYFSQRVLIIQTIIQSIACIIDPFIIYLMIEHNDKEYMMFFRFISIICNKCNKQQINPDIQKNLQLNQVNVVEMKSKKHVSTKNENTSTNDIINGGTITTFDSTSKSSESELDDDTIQIDVDSERTTTSELQRHHEINRKVMNMIRNTQKKHDAAQISSQL